MTVEQLEKELEMMEVPQELYSIMVGGLPNEKLCIAKEDKWQVYYSERGTSLMFNKCLALLAKQLNIAFIR